MLSVAHWQAPRVWTDGCFIGLKSNFIKSLSTCKADSLCHHKPEFSGGSMDIFKTNQKQGLPAPRKFAIIAGFPQKYLIQNETHLSTL
jgi:hypothetical protein